MRSHEIGVSGVVHSTPENGDIRPVRRPRVLTLTTVDITLGKLMLPMIRALEERGFASECASADGPHAKELREMGLIVHSISFTRRVLALSHITAFVQVLRLIQRRRYDVVHVHTPFAQVIGRIAARIAHVPIILYTSHGFQFHESRSRLARRAIIGVERMLARWTDLIFTQSREDAETAIRIGIAPKERIQWIGNGVQLDRFLDVASDTGARKEFGLSVDHRVVGFIGRIVKEKGVVELIEAMAHVISMAENARLLIVGDTLESDGDGAAKGLVHEAILQHRIQDRIIFAGLRDDIPELLRAMDVFVLPSWREGMPRSIIEAMASGLPVVATDVRGCREEVVDGVTGFLVPPRDPASLGAAILKLVDRPDLSRSMGVKGRERALEWFDEKDVIERQLDAYERLLEEKAIYACS